MASQLVITVDTAEASDCWGFVGRVLVGSHEAYRTIRAYHTSEEALEAAQSLLNRVLGMFLAGEEWRSASAEYGHPPLRSELNFGLRALMNHHLGHGGPADENAGNRLD